MPYNQQNKFDLHRFPHQEVYDCDVISPVSYKVEFAMYCDGRCNCKTGRAENSKAKDVLISMRDNACIWVTLFPCRQLTRPGTGAYIEQFPRTACMESEAARVRA